MKTTLKLLLLFFIFSILFTLPSIIIPIPIDQESQSVNPLSILAILLVDLVCIVYLIQRLNLWGIKLFLAVSMVFWGLQTFMTQIETWYFKEAMPAITNDVLLKLFLNPLITAITFIPIAILIFGKWKQPDAPLTSLDEKLDWKAITVLSAVYVVIYYLFGHFVAWQFEEVRLFYSGKPELNGFMAQLQSTMHDYPLLFPFQFIRGFLWILLGLPVIYYLKGNRAEKIVACVFVYSVMTSIQLVIDNPFMPAGVRMAHLLEVSTSNGLFGLLIGLILSKRQLPQNKETGFKQK